jgi:hypothetical protein
MVVIQVIQQLVHLNQTVHLIQLHAHQLPMMVVEVILVNLQVLVIVDQVMMVVMMTHASQNVSIKIVLLLSLNVSVTVVMNLFQHRLQPL